MKMTWWCRSVWVILQRKRSPWNHLQLVPVVLVQELAAQEEILWCKIGKKLATVRRGGHYNLNVCFMVICAKKCGCFNAIMRCMHVSLCNIKMVNDATTHAIGNDTEPQWPPFCTPCSIPPILPADRTTDICTMLLLSNVSLRCSHLRCGTCWWLKQTAMRIISFAILHHVMEYYTTGVTPAGWK